MFFATMPMTGPHQDMMEDIIASRTLHYAADADTPGEIMKAGLQLNRWDLSQLEGMKGEGERVSPLNLQGNKPRPHPPRHGRGK